MYTLVVVIISLIKSLVLIALIESAKNRVCTYRL